MPLQRGERVRLALAVEIARRCAEHAMHRREPFRHQARILQVGDADGEVEALRHHVDEGVGERQVERDLRIGGQEIDEMRRHMHAPEGGRRRDPQEPPRRRGAPRHPGLRLVDRGEDGDDALVEALARFGQRQLPRRALQQPRAQPLLQALDPLRHDGRRKPELAARRRHRAGRDDAREDVELGEAIHGSGNRSPRVVSGKERMFGRWGPFLCGRKAPSVGVVRPSRLVRCALAHLRMRTVGELQTSSS